MRIFKIIIISFVVGSLSLGNSIKTLENKIYNNEINVNNINVEDFLIFLSKESGVTMVPDKEIKNDEINMYIDKNKNFQDILDIFLEVNNYKVSNEGSYLFVEREKDEENKGVILGQVMSLDYGEGLEGAKITFLHENFHTITTLEEGAFKSKPLPFGGYFIKIEKDGYEIAGEIINIDEKENILKIYLEKEHSIKNQKIYENTHIIEKVKVGDLENIKIEEILPLELKEGVTYTRDNKKGVLYISGKRDRVIRAKEYIEGVSHSNKEIRISAQIIDITDNLFNELGFSWIYDRNTGQSEGLVGGILSDSYTAGVGSIFNSTFNFIKTFNNDTDYLNFGFNLLEATQDLTISSTPSIVIANGETGEFKVTQEQIIGQEIVENDEGNRTTYSPIFREAGVVFRVTPEILKEDYLSLKISIESSDFKMLNYGTNTASDEENTYGSKVSRNIDTSVKVRSGETVFIGGLKKGIIQNLESKTKYVADIPVIGFFFKNNKDVKEITDLYIRIKVDIAENKGFEDAGVETFPE